MQGKSKRPGPGHKSSRVRHTGANPPSSPSYAAKRTSQQRHRGTGGQQVAKKSVEAARFLWAGVTALVIAALLFEPTMVWSLAVGTYMVAASQFSGLWLVAAGYGLACLPAAFGLLVATGRFWFSLTHSLWVGAVYAVLGYFFLDQIIGVLVPSAW